MSVSSTNRVAVIVLNWNGLDDTLQCLASIEKSDYTRVDIILVDNASTEPHAIQRLDSYKESSSNEVVLLNNTSNLGFSGGVNTGIRYALSKDYSHIALVNNDAVVNQAWLSRIMETFSETGDVGIVTGSLLHKRGGTIDSTGELYTTWGLPFPRLRGHTKSSLPESGYVFAGTGGATVYKRGVFESIGLFDEVLFAYYEDVDLGFRAQLGGWKTYYQNQAVAYHTQGASSSRVYGFTTKQAVRNLPIVFVKNVPGRLIVPVGIRFSFAYALIVVKALLGRHTKQALVGFLEGMWLFWTHGIPKRFEVQSKKNVSSEYVSSVLIHDLPPNQPGLRKLLRRPVQ